MKVKTIIFHRAFLDTLKREYSMLSKRENEYENKIKEQTNDLSDIKDLKINCEKMIKALEDLLKNKE